MALNSIGNDNSFILEKGRASRNKFTSTFRRKVFKEGAVVGPTLREVNLRGKWCLHRTCISRNPAHLLTLDFPRSINSFQPIPGINSNAMEVRSARRGGVRSFPNFNLSGSARDQLNDDTAVSVSEDATGSLGLSDTVSHSGFIMSTSKRDSNTQEFLKRLCAHLSPDQDTASKRFQKALGILKTRKATGFDESIQSEHVYVERIREHLTRTQGQEAADKFLKVSSQLALKCHAKGDYISNRTALHSFLLTLTSGTDDTNHNKLPEPAQNDKLNQIFRRQKAGRAQSRPLSTPCPPTIDAGDEQLDRRVLKSLLNLLVGLTSDLISVKVHEGELSLNIVGIVSTQLGYKILTAKEVAEHFVRLSNFTQLAAKSKSLVVQRLAEAVEQQLLRHKQLIALLEQMANGGQLSIARMEYLCLQPDNLMHKLATICGPFIENVRIITGNQVLDVLYEQAACSPTNSEYFKLVNALLERVLRPWLDMLHSWMLRGDLSNTHWDFFIHNVGREGVSNLWYEKFAIKKEYVPAYLNNEDTRKILSVGKAMIFLKEADDVHNVSEIQTQLKSILTDEGRQKDFLRSAYSLTMNRMKTVILDNFHLITHLSLIRDVVLLYDGVFSKGLLSNLSGELADSSRTQVERSEITRMIYRLLPEFPDIEAASLISVNFNTGGDDAPLMEGFGLSYKLQEPLSFIFRIDSFALYHRIFAHLFRVRKFSYLFTELSAELQMLKVKAPEIAGVLAQSRLFLHEIMNFVLNLESYLFSHVVTTAWVELERRIDAMSSVDDLSHAHIEFVENLLRGVFLEGDDLAGAHLRILFVEMDEIHSLARSLVDGFESPQRSPSSMRNLLSLFAKCDARIKRYRTSMLEFLRILSEHEDDKMVQFLWMTFDFNLFYSEQHHSLKMSTTQAFRNKIKINRSLLTSSMNTSSMNTSLE